GTHAWAPVAYRGNSWGRDATNASDTLSRGRRTRKHRLRGKSRILLSLAEHLGVLAEQPPGGLAVAPVKRVDDRHVGLGSEGHVDVEPAQPDPGLRFEHQRIPEPKQDGIARGLDDPTMKRSVVPGIGVRIAVRRGLSQSLQLGDQ